MKKLIIAGIILGMFQSALASVDPTLELLNLPSENRKQVWQANGSKHIGDLKSIAFDPSQVMSIRWKALTSVAEIEGAQSLNVMLKASKAPEWYMRNAALVNLQHVDASAAKEVASKLIQDKALVVRSAAVEVLKQSQDTQVRELFWAEMDKDYNFRGTQSLWVRGMMLEHLAKMPLMSERKFFEGYLKDPDQKVKYHAKNAITRLSLGLR